MEEELEVKIGPAVPLLGVKYGGLVPVAKVGRPDALPGAVVAGLLVLFV